MRKIRIFFLIFILLMNSILTTGCWNYREIDELSIVAGVAIDKGEDNAFQMTVEIIQISSGRDIKKTSKILTVEGKTVFDAARNLISLSGKKLYWSHAKVIILSEKIASEGIVKAIEWYNRDAETREEVKLLISEEASAKEILTYQGASEDIKSFVLAATIEQQKSLSKAPQTDILKFDIESKTKMISTVIPVVNLKKADGKLAPQVMGTAIIKNDKLVGFLNEEETKDLIFIRNEVKGGILVEEMQTGSDLTLVSLEIFNNKTKVTPVADNNDIKINLDIETIVSIGEIGGKVNFIDDEGRAELERSTENSLKKRIELLISKVQSEYDADIFGFGQKLRENKIKVWKSVANNWEEVFQNLRVDVRTKIQIKNSAILSRPLEEGE